MSLAIKYSCGHTVVGVPALCPTCAGDNAQAAYQPSASDERHSMVAGLIPETWDMKPFGLAGEIRCFLQSIKDEGTNIDSGGGDGCGDLWVTVQGVEYFISVRKSGSQIAKETNKP